MASLRHSGQVVVVWAALQAAGCGNHVVVETLEPTVLVGFDPVDGTTAYGDGQLAVVVSDYGDYADEAAMAELAARTRLTTWPEQTPVASSIQIELAAAPARDTKLVVVTPTAMLEERWYAVEVEMSDLRPLFKVQSLEGSVGLSGTRFRRDSHPRLSSAKFCGKGATVVVYLYLSEVASLELANVALVQDGQALVCKRSAGPMQIGLDCPTLNLAKPVDLSIGAGGSTASGVAFQSGAWGIDLPKLPLGDCPTFVVPFE